MEEDRTLIRDKAKTKKQLLDEIAELRQRNAERETTDRKRTEAAPRESEEKFRSAFDKAAVPAVIVGPDMNILFPNAAFCDMMGYTEAELSGKSVYGITHPDDVPGNMAITGPLLRGEKDSCSMEKRYIRKDGRVVWGIMNTSSVWDEKGTLLYFVTHVQDITERKRTEERLRESEKKYRRAFVEAGLGIFHSTFDGRFIDLNPALAQMLGYESPEDVMESIKNISQQVYVDPPLRDFILEQIPEEGKTITIENRYYRKSGEEWLARFHIRQVSDDTGKPLYLEGFVEDITDRKRMEQQLREQEHFLSSVANTSPAIVYVYDMEARSIVYTNDGIEEILGYSPAQVQAMGVELFARMIHPDDLQSVINFQSKIERATDDEILENEYRTRHADGSWRFLRTRERPFLRNADGSVRQKIGIALDITERKQMEEELRQSRDELEERVKERTAEVARLASVVQNTKNGIVLVEDFNIVFVNPAFCELTGYSGQELLGKDLSMLRSSRKPEACYEEGRQNAIRTASGTGVWTVQRKDGTTIDLETSMSKIPGDSIMALICQDITEKLRLEEQLRQAHKMEAIGTLAGGIAHDFNNILAAIIGFTEMAMEDVPDRPLVEKNLQYVMTSATRARELVKQILTFSRKTSYERMPISLSHVVQETVKFLRASMPATIDMTFSATASTDTVIAAPVEIQQVIMNLATNALLAMEDRRGILEIVLSDIDFEPDGSLDHMSREYLQFMMKDTGVGMSLDVMKRIFEPFFTTREVGQGSGMGLAVVYGIVRDLGGTITVESEPERGSTFRVLLPKARVEAEEEPKQASLPRGNERILFIDDEPLLVDWGKEALKRLGYTVTTVEDGRQALMIFAADPFLFDLVITDQAMPQIPGSDLCIELLQIRKDIPIILCTGHSETISPDKAEEIGIRGFLIKPVTRQELALTVRRVLDAG